MQLLGICRWHSRKGSSRPFYQTPCFIGEEMETQSYDLCTISEGCCILRAEEHGYALSHVLWFSKSSSVFPTEHKLQLFWIRTKKARVEAEGFHLDMALTVFIGSLSGLPRWICPIDLPLEDPSHAIGQMVLCFLYGEGIFQSSVNPPATTRKRETLLWGRFCFWNADEVCKSGYLEWGCPRAGWGGIQEVGTSKKLQSVSNHQRGHGLGGSMRAARRFLNLRTAPRFSHRVVLKRGTDGGPW